MRPLVAKLLLGLGSSQLIAQVHVELPELDIGFTTFRVLLDDSIQHLEGKLRLPLLTIDVYLAHCNLTEVVVIVLDLLSHFERICLSDVQQVAAEPLLLAEETELK